MRYFSLLVSAIAVLLFQRSAIPETAPDFTRDSKENTTGQQMTGNLRAALLQARSQVFVRKEQVSQIHVWLPDDFQLGVDSIFKFEVAVTFLHKGKERVKSTEVKPFKPIMDWKLLDIEISGGKRKGTNKVIVNRDLEGCTNGTLTIRARLKSDPDITGTCELHLLSARSLLLGTIGQEGKSGRRALLHGKNAKYNDQGECIRTAERGNDGWDGSDGEDGHEIVVFVKKKYNPYVNRNVLYYAIIDKTLNDTSYVIADTASPVLIKATGGNGGDGGHGSRGGDGYTDSRLSICSDPAPGGDGGKGGRGGNGGSIIVHADTSVDLEHLNVRYSCAPGKGGSGGFEGAGGSRSKCQDRPEKTEASGKPGVPGADGKEGKEVQIIQEPVSDF